MADPAGSGSSPGMAHPAEPEPMPPDELRDLCRISLYAALIGAGAFLHIPFGPMHISLQTLMVMLAGFVLGPGRAVLAIGVYLAAGFVGIPVFGRGIAGPAAFLGPTSGFFLGFVPAAALAGLAARAGGGVRGMAARLAAGAAGSAVLLLCGTVMLRCRFIPDWDRAMLAGFYPFLIGDLVKMGVAVAVRERFFAGGGKSDA